MTPEQEKFLAAFADEGLAAQQAEQERIAAVEKQRQIDVVTEQAVADIKAKADADIAEVLAAVAKGK